MTTVKKSKPAASASSERSFDREYAVNALKQIWDHWVQGLGHSEAAAQKKMKSVITHLHQTETKKKSQKSTAKKKASLKKAKTVGRSKKRSK